MPQMYKLVIVPKVDVFAVFYKLINLSVLTQYSGGMCINYIQKGLG